MLGTRVGSSRWNGSLLPILLLAGFVFGSLWLFINSKTVACTHPSAKIVQPIVPQNTNPTQPPIYIDNEKNKEKEGKGSKYDYAGLTKPKRFRNNYVDSDPVVCIIVRTYEGHVSALPALITALASGDYPHLHIFLLDTQDDFETLPKFESLFNSLYQQDFVHTTNVTKAYSRQRFPDFPSDQSDFGYLQTDLMLEQLSSPASTYQCEYFVATNGDNLYSKDLLSLTIHHMRNKVDLIPFDFITHYCYEDSRSWRPKPGCYSQHYTEIKLQRIDVGAALFRKQKLVETNSNFLINELRYDPTGSHVQLYFCDGYFYENFAKAGATVAKVNATLLVHQ